MKSQRNRGINVISKEQNPQNQPKSQRRVQISQTWANYLAQKLPSSIYNLMIKLNYQNEKEGQNTNNYKNQMENHEDHSLPNTQSRIAQAKCSICENDIYLKENVKMFSEKCQHKFCQQCLDKYLQFRFSSLQPIICPHQSCNQPIDKDAQYYKNLKTQFKNQCSKIQLFLSIANDKTKKLCPGQFCELGVVTIDQKNKNAKCDKCETVFCNNCMMKKHEGKCDTTQINYLQNQFKYRKCKNCKMVIEKIEGCNHMTCNCGFQFCYLCGRTFTFTHSCPNWFSIFQDLPQPIKIILKIIFMVLFIIVFLILLILAVALCLIVGIIGGATVGPPLFIYNCFKNYKQIVGILAIIFYPITILVLMVLATGYLFITIFLDKICKQKLSHIFYDIKQF